MSKPEQSEVSAESIETPDFNPDDPLIKEFIQKCEGNNIEVQLTFPEIRLMMQCGRFKREVLLLDRKNIQRAITCDFEKHTFISDYGAIFRSEDRYLEIGLRHCTSRWRNEIFFRFLRQVQNETEGISRTLGTIIFEQNDIGTPIQAEIGPPTEVFCILNELNFGADRYVTLKIKNLHLFHHDELADFIERFSGSVCFSIELNYNTALTLIRKRELHRSRSKYGLAEPSTIALPSHEYDRAPISLYFYGRSATEFPLVQFLAFYQVLEFYFPVCHRAEAGRRVKQLLKDPTFNRDRDSDISRLLDRAEGRNHSGQVSERAMLRSTLAETTDPTELLAFLKHNETAAKIFQSKLKGLSENKINFDLSPADLLSNVANRIYDIRCKIVHTKASDEDKGFELLLPNSEEAKSLHYDVELIQFLSRQAITYGSHPFKY